MGMAASQARLLCITARIHDVEFQAQMLQQAKMSLSQKSNDIMQEYLAILSGEQMTVNATNPGSAVVQSITATYNNLMSVNSLTGSSGQKYAITDVNGLLIVPNNVYKAYQTHAGSDYCDTAEEFAVAMLVGGAGASEEDIDNAIDDPKYKNEANYQYYFQMFNLIKNCGGCVSIDSFDGPSKGDAENDAKWLDGMVRKGTFSINIIQNNKKTGEVTLGATSMSTDTGLHSTPYSELDEAERAKIEAKYEHELKQIDNKDKQYDMKLAELETERNALTTQYDSVKKVIEDNIERTFGIFS